MSVLSSSPSSSSTSAWLLQLPAIVEEMLYARTDLQIIDELKPMRRTDEKEIIMNVRKHLCVPEGLRLAGSATSSSTNVSIDADYLRTLVSAIRAICTDAFFSSTLLQSSLPRDDLYVWPSVLSDVSAMIRLRIRWLENRGEKTAAEQLNKALRILIGEVSLCGLIPLEDTSSAVMGEEVVCKRLRTEESNLLVPLKGDNATCGAMWSIPPRYSRKLLQREEVPMLVKTFGKVILDGIHAQLSSLMTGTALTRQLNPTADILPATFTVAQFLQFFPSFEGHRLAAILKASAATNRSYLRTGVALSILEMPSVVLVETQVALMALGRNVSFAGLPSTLLRRGGGEKSFLSWEEAVEEGRVVTFEAIVNASKGKHIPRDLLPSQTGTLSRFPFANVSEVRESTVAPSSPASAGLFVSPVSITTVSFSNNFFFIVHGQGVQDGIPLPRNVMSTLEGSANGGEMFI